MKVKFAGVFLIAKALCQNDDIMRMNIYAVDETSGSKPRPVDWKPIEVDDDTHPIDANIEPFHPIPIDERIIDTDYPEEHYQYENSEFDVNRRDSNGFKFLQPNKPFSDNCNYNWTNSDQECI